MVRFTRSPTVSRPSLAVLIPQSEEVDEDTREQLRPPGLWLVSLPQTEDLRFSPSSIADSDDSAVTRIETQVSSLVTTLTRSPDFNYLSLSSPSVQLFYNTLQSLALNEERRETTDDLTAEGEAEERARPVAAALSLALFGGEGGSAEEMRGAGKKKGGTGGRGTKKVKEEEEVVKEVKKGRGRGTTKKKVEEEDEDGEEAPKRKRAVKRKVKEEDEDEDEEVPKKRATTRGRGTKKAKYDEDDDFEM